MRFTEALILGSNVQTFPLSINIEGCVELPCEIIKGKTAVIDVHFVATPGVSLPYELSEYIADVCKKLMYTVNCALLKTEDVVYQFNFYIDSYHPEVVAKIELTLIDEENESIETSLN